MPLVSAVSSLLATFVICAGFFHSAGPHCNVWEVLTDDFFSPDVVFCNREEFIPCSFPANICIRRDRHYCRPRLHVHGRPVAYLHRAPLKCSCFGINDSVRLLLPGFV